MVMSDENRYSVKETAVIVIDVQNDYCSADGALGRRGFDVSRVQRMVPRLKDFIQGAERCEVPVVYIRTTHDETTDTPQWLGRVGKTSDGDLLSNVICRTGSWGSEFYEISPGPEDLVITKHRFSAFVGTRLDLTLRSLGVSSLLFTGVTTDICVGSSVRDGLFHEYYVSVVEDCSEAFSKSAHEETLKNIASNFGTIVKSDMIMNVWKREADRKSQLVQ